MMACVEKAAMVHIARISADLDACQLCESAAVLAACSKKGQGGEASSGSMNLCCLGTAQLLVSGISSCDTS